MDLISSGGGLLWLTLAVAPAQPVRSADDSAALCQMLDEHPPLERMLPREPPARAEARKAWMDQHERAQEAVYQADLPTRTFRLGPYDPESQEVGIVPRWPLRVAGGSLLLSPEDAPELGLTGEPANIDVAYRHWRTGEGFVRVRFRPAEGGCSGRMNSGAYLLDVSIVSIEYLSNDGASLLRGSGDFRPEVAASGKPSVRVDAVVVEKGRVNEAALAAALDDEPGLLRCYRSALVDRPDLEGVAVFRGAVGSAGRAADVTVTLDGLGVEPLVACLRRQLGRVRLPGAATGSRLYLPLELGLR